MGTKEDLKKIFTEREIHVIMKRCAEDIKRGDEYFLEETEKWLNKQSVKNRFEPEVMLWASSRNGANILNDPTPKNKPKYAGLRDKICIQYRSDLPNGFMISVCYALTYPNGKEIFTQSAGG